MFWVFILAIILGLILVKLGAYSILVSVLSIGLKLAVLLIAGFVVISIWNKFYKQT